jgi:hypothetical protein
MNKLNESDRWIEPGRMDGQMTRWITGQLTGQMTGWKADDGARAQSPSHSGPGLSRYHTWNSARSSGASKLKTIWAIQHSTIMGSYNNVCQFWSRRQLLQVQNIHLCRWFRLDPVELVHSQGTDSGNAVLERIYGKQGEFKKGLWGDWYDKTCWMFVRELCMVW